MNNKFKTIVTSLLLLTLCGCGDVVTTSNKGGNINSNGGNNVTSKVSTLEIIEGTWSLNSPNNQISITNSLINGQLFYEVNKDNKEIVKRSSLGFNTNQVDFSEKINFVKKVENENVEINYDTITGKKSHVSTKYNEVILTFEKYGYYLDFIIRAYNDGYAFRYKIYAESELYSTLTIGKEYSSFSIPSNSKMFVQPANLERDYFSYEETYLEVKPDRINGSLISMPLLYKTPDNIYSLITEADLYGHDYIGSFLKGDKTGNLNVIPSYGASEQNAVSLPFESPWRLGVVGGIDTIVSSTLVEDVYDEVEYWKPDNYEELSKEEQDIYNYDWVTPGAAAWDWLYNPKNQGDYDMHKEYLELAKEMGWKWIILDGGWTPQDPEDILGFQELVADAHANGIKVMVWGWAHTHMGEYDNMVQKLDLWKSRGIDGVKIDYFDGNEQATSERVESQNTITITERLYQECAKRQMVVNCHGCNKPTGERRVYPHVINREAVRGNEMANNISEFLTTSPFIRGSIGPTDYTPTLLPMNENVTVGHQLALHILFETGSISMGDKIEVYQQSIAKDFLSKLPATFDDVKYIEGEPTSHCVLGRRDGNDWWIAGNTTKEREVSIDLSFLGDGEYSADIYYDGTDYLTLENKKENVNKNSSIKVKLSKNGGFALRIIKK